MALWVEACPDAVAPVPPATCTAALQWVDVTASQPFQLTSAHLSTMGEAFAAGVFLVVSFWGLGYGAGLIMKALKS